MLCMQGGERDVVKLLDFRLVKELGGERDVQLTGASTLTADDARLWWLEHQAALQPAAAPNTSGPKTIAVQGLRPDAS